MQRILAVVLTAASIEAAALTQHQDQDHQAPGSQASTAPSAELVSACVAAQRHVTSIAEAVNARIEEARQTNSPQEMRAALADLQAALVEIRARAAACSPLQAAAAPADPHAGHTMPSKPVAPGTPEMRSGSAAPAPAARAPKPQAAPDPHAGHTMPAQPPAAAPRGKPEPPAAKTPKPAAADPHAGHQPAAPEKPAGKQRDPVTGLMVDPATAPKTTYQGQTYYFSSEASKKEFLENPGKFARKPKR